MSGQTPKLDAANARMLTRRRPTPTEMNIMHAGYYAGRAAEREIAEGRQRDIASASRSEPWEREIRQRPEATANEIWAAIEKLAKDCEGFELLEDGRIVALRENGRRHGKPISKESFANKTSAVRK